MWINYIRMNKLKKHTAYTLYFYIYITDSNDRKVLLGTILVKCEINVNGLTKNFHVINRFVKF